MNGGWWLVLALGAPLVFFLWVAANSDHLTRLTRAMERELEVERAKEGPPLAEQGVWGKCQAAWQVACGVVRLWRETGSGGE